MLRMKSFAALAVLINAMILGDLAQAEPYPKARPNRNYKLEGISIGVMGGTGPITAIGYAATATPALHRRLAITYCRDPR